MFYPSFFYIEFVLFLMSNISGMENNITKKRSWRKVLKNKYFIASILFLTWIIFFDENSFISHAENKQRLNDLNKQKEYYLDRIESDKQKLEDLNTGEKELEKFAREQYFMSKPNEDLFIVVEEED